jgi:DNA-binding MarR family transcriptional regulator
MSRRAGPAQQSLSSFKLDQHIFFLFGQIYGRRDLQLARSLRPLGLSVAHWRILAALSNVEACTINRLADLTVIDRTTLSRTLDRMEANGLVARRQLANDKRSFEMRLAPAGRRALERIWPVIEYHNRRAVAGLTRRELEELRRTVRKMIANVAEPPEM